MKCSRNSWLPSKKGSLTALLLRLLVLSCSPFSPLVHLYTARLPSAQCLNPFTYNESILISPLHGRELLPYFTDEETRQKETMQLSQGLIVSLQYSQEAKAKNPHLPSPQSHSSFSFSS